jgi:predicted transcriptional regulator
MPADKLRSEIEKLHKELRSFAPDDHDSRDKLNELLGDLERKLERPDDEEHHHSLMRIMKDTIAHIETEHPRATAILNDIMVTLSNMGI